MRNLKFIAMIASLLAVMLVPSVAIADGQPTTDAGDCSGTIEVVETTYEKNYARFVIEVTDGDLCEGEVYLSSGLTWERHSWQLPTDHSDFTYNKPQPEGSRFKMIVDKPAECWYVSFTRAFRHGDGAYGNTDYAETCSQQRRDQVDTFNLTPAVFISNEIDGRVTAELAGFFGVPNVIVRNDSLSQDQLLLLRDIASSGYGQTATVAGGSAALSDDLFNGVKEIWSEDPHGITRRVWGENRYDTLVELLRFLPDNPQGVVVD